MWYDLTGMYLFTIENTRGNDLMSRNFFTSELRMSVQVWKSVQNWVWRWTPAGHKKSRWSCPPFFAFIWFVNKFASRIGMTRTVIYDKISEKWLNVNIVAYGNSIRRRLPIGRGMKNLIKNLKNIILQVKLCLYSMFKEIGVYERHFIFFFYLGYIFWPDKGGGWGGFSGIFT